MVYQTAGCDQAFVHFEPGHVEGDDLQVARTSKEGFQKVLIQPGCGLQRDPVIHIMAQNLIRGFVKKGDNGVS